MQGPSGDAIERASRFASPRMLAVLFAISAFVLLFDNLGGYRTFAYHEVRAVVPAREMLRSGDWTVPRFGGVPRLTKPPLVYWMLATVGGVCGQIDEFVARIPQAVAAVLLCLLMAVWATRWYGREAGWVAAFVQLTTAWLLVWGRKAEIDMTIWLLTTAALFLIGTQPDHESGRRNFLRWAGVYALLAIAWLGKFHYAPALVFAPVGLFLLIQKRYRALWNFANPVGLLLLSAAVLLWPLLVLREMPGAWEIWIRETVGRAAGGMGEKPLWYYLPRVLTFALPWTPLALLAVRPSWRRAWRDGDPRERFLWAWFLTHLAIVSLQPNKHSHYLISAMPMLTLLATQYVAALLQRVREGRWRITPMNATRVSIVVVCVTAAATFTAIRKHPELFGPMLAIGGLVAGGCCIGLQLTAAKQHIPARLTALFVFLAGWMIVNRAIVPARDHRRELVAFARSSRRAVGDEVPIYGYFQSEDPAIAYLGEPVRRVASPDELTQSAKTDATLRVVTYRGYLPQLKSVGRVRVLSSMPANHANRHRRHPPLVLVEFQDNVVRETNARIAAGSGNGRVH